jgi:hypothetical protein
MKLPIINYKVLEDLSIIYFKTVIRIQIFCIEIREGLKRIGQTSVSVSRKSLPRFLLTDPMLFFTPGITIMIVVSSFNIVGDGLRDAIDLSLRGTI